MVFATVGCSCKFLTIKPTHRKAVFRPSVRWQKLPLKNLAHNFNELNFKNFESYKKVNSDQNVLKKGSEFTFYLDWKKNCLKN